MFHSTNLFANYFCT